MLRAFSARRAFRNATRCAGRNGKLCGARLGRSTLGVAEPRAATEASMKRSSARAAGTHERGNDLARGAARCAWHELISLHDWLSARPSRSRSSPKRHARRPHGFHNGVAREFCPRIYVVSSCGGVCFPPRRYGSACPAGMRTGLCCPYPTGRLTSHARHGFCTPNASASRQNGGVVTSC